MDAFNGLFFLILLFPHFTSLSYFIVLTRQIKILHSSWSCNSISAATNSLYKLGILAGDKCKTAKINNTDDRKTVKKTADQWPSIVSSL